MQTTHSAWDVLHYWFKELTPKQHFAKDVALDALGLDQARPRHCDAAESLQ